MNARGTETKERRFTKRRGIQGGVASALPWVLTVAAIALFVLAAVARGAEETRILTAHWVLDRDTL
jgi:hypothetical protein